ncbi:MAG: hypothetical protein IJA70_06480 [Oscillospiraceae bacterium]|nr:hypothetical protein [Oscillospiraceae bacterium]
MITYTLIFIGTAKYKYPLIAPITQAIVAPLEIWMAFFIIIGNSQFNYITVSYIYWTIVEIAIFLMIRKVYPFTKRQVIQYIIVLAFFASVIYYVMILKEQFLFSHYFFSLIGMIFWLKFIFNEKYIFKPITLAIFVSKFIADFTAIPVYFGSKGIVVNMLCVLLPLLDFIFIVVYFFRRRRAPYAENPEN